jgi:hypothetical protein
MGKSVQHQELLYCEVKGSLGLSRVGRPRFAPAALAPGKISPSKRDPASLLVPFK